jgi:hypothetical protein
MRFDAPFQEWRARLEARRAAGDEEKDRFEAKLGADCESEAGANPEAL